MPLLLNRIKAGDLIEDWKVFSLRTPGKKAPRGKNRKVSSQIQKDKNFKNSKNQMDRLACQNFVFGDQMITLSYADPFLPKNYEEAQRECKNFLRRVNYNLRKQGLKTIKYMGCTEGKDQRWNHHIMISHVNLELLEELWGKGWVNMKRLHIDNDFKGLTNYISKEEKEPQKRRWFQSRNLEQPKVEPPKVVSYTYDLKTPPGYIKIDGGIYATEFGFSEYAKYIRIGGFNFGTGKKAPMPFQKLEPVIGEKYDKNKDTLLPASELKRGDCRAPRGGR